MTNTKIYIVEGKFTTGRGSAYETLETVYPEDGGAEEAQRLTREHQLAHGPGYPIRYRPARPTNDV